MGLSDLTNRPTPQVITGYNDVVDIGCGDYHSLIVRKNGDAYSFGFNNEGQLGLGTITDQETSPIKVVNGLNVKKAYGSVRFSMLITSIGLIYGMGNNNGFNLGTFDNNDKNVPTPVSNQNYKVRKLALGSQHSVALTTTGRIYVFGKNDVNLILFSNFYF